MIADTLHFYKVKWKGIESFRKPLEEYQLLLVFGDKLLLNNPMHLLNLKELFPNATIVSSSSAGEIHNQSSGENEIVCTAISFNHTPLSFSLQNINSCPDSRELGNKAARELSRENLRYILTLSDGRLINGSELMEGITEIVGADVIISGGMAGDNDRFQDTLVGLDKNIQEGNLVLVGLYGPRLKVGVGSYGGFTSFGPERRVTKSDKNILYEIDGQNALELYKRYLGIHAKELPGSALFFPIGISNPQNDDKLVRTILSIDEKNQSMTFAGNIPTGSKIRLMRASMEHLISTAGSASSEALKSINRIPALALIMNCVGRKIVLADRAQEETITIRNTLPAQTTVAGMYTYGEFASPNTLNSVCCLHNQTVVVTLFHED